MKKVITAVIIIAISISLCACGANENVDDTIVSSQIGVSASEAESDAAQSDSKRNALMTYQVEINGITLTIPCSYSDLTALGYSVPEDEELDSNTYTIGTYLKNESDDSLHVQFWNGSSEKKKYSECEVCEIEISLGNDLDITLPNGIKFDENLTPEQVIEAYGEADYDHDTDDYHALDYDDGGFKKIDFMFYKQDNMKKRSTVTINHIVD